MSELVVVTEGGTINIDGVDHYVRAGELFESDHPAVAKYPNLFGPITLHYPKPRKTSARTEQATKAPGEKRKR